MKTVSSYSFTAGNNYIDLQTAVGDGLVLSVSYDTGIAQTPKLIFGMGNDPKDDTVFEVAWTGSTRKNAFEVTQDGYLRTGVGMAKIAFGKNGNGEYGYWIPATQSEPETFVPWITSPGPTYTAGTNIDITNNVISAPNVAPIVNGKVPEQYLPSYVDDVIEGYYNPTDGKFYEESTYQTEISGERGKIYISLDTDKSYRWGGTVYVELTSGGVVYTAGDGIDISATNEISVDGDIARLDDIPTIPTNVSAFVNDAGYLTQHQDLSNYIQKSLTAGLVKNDGTIDTTAYATASALTGYLPLAGGTMAGVINSQNIIPATDDSYRLGSSSSKYNSAYIKRIYNLASIESTTDGSKRLLVPAKSGTIAVNEDLPEVVGNLIAVNPILESGTLIANITISGVSTNIYAPSGGSTYTAGDGIDISNNEISVDDTIARVGSIPSHTSDLTNDSGFITINDIPTIPDELADLSDDSTHRLVTDTEKTTWNGKQGALTAGTGIALSSANTISIKYYGAHAEVASGGANNNKREGMADSGDGMFLTGSYNDPNAPYTYGNIINLNGGGTGQLFLGWRGDSNTGPLYYRSHRDNASAAWGAWKQIAYTSDIPSVGNGTLTIQKNGTNVQTFTANQSGSAIANIFVPFDYDGNPVDDDSSDEGFKGLPHYGKFGSDSSIGNLMGSEDGVYMFLPWGTSSTSYGFVLACDDSSDKFYLGSLTGEDDSAINWSRIYHDNYHPLAGKADFIKFPRNAVNYDTAMRSRSGETVAFDELSGTTGHPSFISTFTNPWFNLITMHSPDANYGSQLAIPMTGFTAPAWRYFAGNNFGSWEYIPSADALSVGNSSTPVYLENGKLKAGSALPDISTKVSKSGDTMNGGLKWIDNNSYITCNKTNGHRQMVISCLNDTHNDEILLESGAGAYIRTYYDSTKTRITGANIYSSFNSYVTGNGNVDLTAIKGSCGTVTGGGSAVVYIPKTNIMLLAFLSCQSSGFFAVRMINHKTDGTVVSTNLATSGTSRCNITLNTNSTNYWSINVTSTGSSYPITYNIIPFGAGG